MNWLANYPFFFDGPEYVALSRLPIADALMQAHPLTHPVSILLWRLAYLGLGESVAALSFVSWLFWVGGTMLAVSCVERGKRWVMYAICFLLPLPWLVMTNVGVDAVSTFLFVAGVAIIWRRRSWLRVGVATTMFGLSILNYLGMMVWLAIPVVIIWFDHKLSKRSRLGMAGGIMTSAMIGIGALLAMGLWTRGVGVGLARIPVAIYHAGVAFVANYTWVSALVVVGFGISWVRGREWKKLLVMLGIGCLYTISLLPWHSGPYGRLGIFAVYPLAYLYSRLPRGVIILLIALILPSWFKVVKAYQEKPLAIRQQEIVDASLCRDKQLIFSEIQRPQLALVYPTAWYAGPSNWEEVVGKIEDNENICISRQALDFPYRQFEGQLPYPLSGLKRKGGFLSLSLEKKKLEVVGEDVEHPELTVYTISR